MKPFKSRRQSAKHPHRIGASFLCQWVEITTDDMRIVIKASRGEHSLGIRVEANGVIYHLPDSLLELILSNVAEEYGVFKRVL